MAQIESLLQNLQERRQKAAATSLTSSSPQLDLVRTFSCYASSEDTDPMPLEEFEKSTDSSHYGSRVSGSVVGSSEGSLCLRRPTKSSGQNSSESTTTSRPEPKPLIRNSLPFTSKLRHWLIVSRWQRWLFPVCCAVPYLGILFWLLSRGLIWVAQVLLAPLVMGGVGWLDLLACQARVQ